MRKFHVLGLALTATVMFAAFTAASAFAESELLAKGTTIAAGAELPIEITGELLLEDMGAVGKPDILCTGIFDGHTVGPKLAFITALLMSNGELLDENGGTTGPNDMVDCVSDNGTCEGEVLVTVLNMPWHIEIELSGTTFLAHFLKAGEEGAGETTTTPEYDVDCQTFLGLVEDKCGGLTFAKLENMAEEDLLGIFDETSPAVPCSQSSGEQGLLEGNGLITIEGGAASVS